MSLFGVFRFILLAALSVGAAVVVWLALPAHTAVHIPPGVSSINPGMAERGAYLVRAGGCITCHLDRKGGGKPFAGGLAFPSPYGRSIVPTSRPTARLASAPGATRTSSVH